MRTLALNLSRLLALNLSRLMLERPYIHYAPDPYFPIMSSTSHIPLTFERELTHFQPMLQFFTPLKHQKTSSFLMFSGGIEVEHGLKTD